jgi:hypothetical protein
MPTPRSASRRTVRPNWALTPTFHLINFVLIACYVELLVADGNGLTAAIAAALTVAAGARATGVPMSGRSSEPNQA